MNIIIQGSQGQGKTRTAEYIASAYDPDAIVRALNFRHRDGSKIIKRCSKIIDAGLIPLIIFDDLDAKSLTKALTFTKRLFFKDAQIDKIYITNERLNIS